jgi:predicted AlkP superfamily phosphohydrolase/phosphomutase
VNRFFQDIDSIISKQSTALKFLLGEKEWEFFWAVFSFTDWMQHVLWKFIDKTHPLHDPIASKPVQKKYQDVWRRIDSIIGDLINLLPADSVFMIVSDHGAGPLDSVFYPNAWLHKKGWLKKRQMGWRGFVTERVRLFSDGSDNKYVRKIHQVLREKVMRLSGSIDLIDLGGSLAYSPEHNTMFGCISLTRRGKEREGFREELIEEIRRLPENLAGIREVEVILPEVIYSGPYVNLSPDIFFIINNYKTTVEVDLARDPFVNSPSIDMRTGGHQPEGVFMARGEGIVKGKLKDLNVLDIAPTILALFGMKPSQQMDGKVITDCMKPEMVKASEPTSKACPIEESGPIEETGDLDEMKKMLKSLGYM